MKLNGKGFTMVELLVVLLIIGVLAAIATPLYLANTNRAKASEAVATMGMIRQAEREFYTKHNAYVEVGAGDLYTSPPTTKTGSGATAKFVGGLGIDVGHCQYFSNSAYRVDLVDVGSALNTATGAGGFDFVITATGTDSVESETTGTTTSTAPKEADVFGYIVKMDNGGTIAVKYGDKAWEQY